MEEEEAGIQCRLRGARHAHKRFADGCLAANFLPSRPDRKARVLPTPAGREDCTGHEARMNVYAHLAHTQV